MKKIVLMGNPNVGKSVVFSRLTGANVIVSNYPGTTVDFSKGKMCRGREGHEIIDAPGTYSLEPSNRAEEVALEMFNQADLIINVVDAPDPGTEETGHPFPEHVGRNASFGDFHRP